MDHPFLLALAARRALDEHQASVERAGLVSGFMAQGCDPAEANRRAGLYLHGEPKEYTPFGAAWRNAVYIVFWLVVWAVVLGMLALFLYVVVQVALDWDSSSS